MADFKQDLEATLLAHRSDFASKTPDFILADFITACLAAYESKVMQESTLDTTEYLNECLAAYQAAALARWRWMHVAVSLGFPKV